MLKVTSYDKTIEILKEEFTVASVQSETVPITEALGRVLAKEIIADEDLPPYSRSTMDGYAVMASDTFGTSSSQPAMLELSGSIAMGEYIEGKIRKGTAYGIATGGMLIEGADSVVMVEYTEELDKNTVLIEKSVSPGENVIRRGDDIRLGERLFQQGHILRPQDIGALASLGIESVCVNKRMSVGIISTGNEIVNPFGPAEPGKIRDINTYLLTAAVRKDGYTAKSYDIVPDDFEKLRGALLLALKENDSVLLSGGSSVGIMDQTLKVINSIEGAKMLIEGIALKPGKPTIVADISGKPVFGLPGHPVSAFVLYYAAVSPLYRFMNGQKHDPEVKKAYFFENYATQPGRDEFIMVKLINEEGRTLAKPIHAKSGMFITITKADGFVRVPANKEGLYKDEEVSVQLF